MKISPSKYFWLGLFSIFFLIAAVLYSPSLGGPWQYDDYAQILDEKVLTGRSLPLLLSSTFRFTAHPDGWTGTRDLVRASFLLNWKWWGTDPAGYRWVNLLIHVINATLVAGLVYLLMTNDKYIPMTNEKSKKSGHLSLVQIGADLSLPALAGLLFLVHPIQSQAVAYVAQRFTSMATMFYLLTIILYIRFCEVYPAKQDPAPQGETSRHRGNNFYNRYNSYKYYILALLSAGLAFNSKEIAVTLPFALLLVSIMTNDKYVQMTNGKAKTGWHLSLVQIGADLSFVIFLIPFFLLSLKIPSQIISSSYSHTGQLSKLAEVAVDSLALKQKAVDLTRHDYFLTQINVVGTYLRLAVLPVKQTLDYDYPLTTAPDLKTVGLGILHLSLISAGAWLLLKPRRQKTNDGKMTNDKYIPMTNEKSKAVGHLSLVQIGADLSFRLIGFGILWFYLTLLPESSVVPIADLIYEHRTYLPMVGLVIAITGVIAMTDDKYSKYIQMTNGKRKPFENLSLVQIYHLSFVIISIWLFLLSIATLRRAYIWGNEVRLWGDIYEKAPNKPRANKNYGVVLAAAGKYEEGVKRLARAVELEPENADYWSNFGTAYLRWGKYEESAGKFLKAYELFVLQHPSISSGPSDSSNSPKDLKQAAQYMNDYGVSMVQLQRGDEALEGFQKALKIDPTLYAAWLGLGAAYNIKGDSEMAIKTFFQVVKDFPDQPDGYNNLAIVLKKAGRTEEAAAVLARMPKNK